MKKNTNPVRIGKDGFYKPSVAPNNTNRRYNRNPKTKSRIRANEQNLNPGRFGIYTRQRPLRSCTLKVVAKLPNQMSQFIFVECLADYQEEGCTSLHCIPRVLLSVKNFFHGDAFSEILELAVHFEDGYKSSDNL